MKLRNALVLGLALCGTTAVHAEDFKPTNWYVGLSASSFNLERAGTGSRSYATNGYLIKVGYDLGKYLSVEARMGAGDSSTTDAASLRLEAQRVSAAYVRANLPFDKIKVYALGGYSSVSVRGEVVGTGNGTGELKGVSYGVGIELYGNSTTAITAEYMRYANNQKLTNAVLSLDNEFDVNAVSFGLVHHF